MGVLGFIAGEMPFLEHFIECADKHWSPDSNKIAKALLHLHKEVLDLRATMATKADLDNVIATIGTSIEGVATAANQVATDVHNLVTAIENAGVTADFTTEISALQSSGGALQSAAAALTSAHTEAGSVPSGGTPQTGG